MSAILKENVLRGKGKDVSGKERVDRLIDAIVKPSDSEKQTKTEGELIKTTAETTVSETNLLQDIFSSESLAEGEDSCALAEIRNRLTKELNPSGGLEIILVDRIVSGIWRLKRCLKIERQIIEYCGSSIQEYEQGFFRTRKRSDKELKQLKALKITEDESRIGELSKYEAMLEWQIYKALHELTRLRRRESTQEKKASKKAK